MTKKPTIYLGGPMEGVSEDIWTWRGSFKEDPMLSEVVTYLDPTLRKAFHSQLYSPNLCRKVMKTDLYDIDRSDIIVANLKDRGDGKCWGTVAEIMYAYTKNKTIIVIMEEDFKHPFIEAMATVLCHTVEEGVKELKDFVAWMV